MTKLTTNEIVEQFQLHLKDLKTLQSGTKQFEVMENIMGSLYNVKLCNTCSSQAATYYQLIKKWVDNRIKQDASLEIKPQSNIKDIMTRLKEMVEENTLIEEVKEEPAVESNKKKNKKNKTNE